MPGPLIEATCPTLGRPTVNTAFEIVLKDTTSTMDRRSVMLAWSTLIGIDMDWRFAGTNVRPAVDVGSYLRYCPRRSLERSLQWMTLLMYESSMKTTADDVVACLSRPNRCSSDLHWRSVDRWNVLLLPAISTSELGCLYFIMRR